MGARLKEAGFDLSALDLFALYEVTAEPFSSLARDALMQWHPSIIGLVNLYRTNYQELREAERRGSIYARLVTPDACGCLRSFGRKIVSIRVLLGAFEDSTAPALPPVALLCQGNSCRWRLNIIPMELPKQASNPAFSRWMDEKLGRSPEITTAQEWRSLVERVVAEDAKRVSGQNPYRGSFSRPY